MPTPDAPLCDYVTPDCRPCPRAATVRLVWSDSPYDWHYCEEHAAHLLRQAESPRSRLRPPVSVEQVEVPDAAR